MSYTKAKEAYKAQADAAKAPEIDTRACAAYGCPARGSVDLTGSGKFVCSCHAVAAPAKWQEVTRAIRDHDWLLGLIGDLQRQYMGGTSKVDYVRYATEFWATDPFMVPSPVERDHWPLYLERLRSELAFRVGVNSKRPAPRAPAAPTERRGAAPAPLIPTELMTALQKRMDGSWGDGKGPRVPESPPEPPEMEAECV